MNTMNILITGGAGFIGHHLVEYLLDNTDHTLTLIDRLDTSGTLSRLAAILERRPPASRARVRFIYHDIKSPIGDHTRRDILRGGHPRVIIHMAAGTHVDRSIQDPLGFVMDNVVGTTNMLDFAKDIGVWSFINFSTDEVFGPASRGEAFVEDDPHHPNNPYAASKSGAVQMGFAYHNTYKVPVVTTYTMNVIGIRQHPEKFVPSTIGKVMRREKVLIHADPTKTTPGSRVYIHARDVASAVAFVMANGLAGETYNIVGIEETNNLEMAQEIAGACGVKLNYELVDFHSSRPGHDLRYALSGEKLRRKGWGPLLWTSGAVEEVVKWSLLPENKHWVGL
jgi:dTDP-glucose 4,6-dehydratase